MDATQARAASKMLADLAESGGGTYEAGTYLPFTPNDGYAVGIGGVRLPMAAVNIESVVWAARMSATEYEASFVGTWLDDEVVYFDAVEYFAIGNVDRALARARELGQKAIYSFRDKGVITL